MPAQTGSLNGFLAFYYTSVVRLLTNLIKTCCACSYMYLVHMWVELKSCHTLDREAKVVFFEQSSLQKPLISRRVSLCAASSILWLVCKQTQGISKQKDLLTAQHVHYDNTGHSLSETIT